MAEDKKGSGLFWLILLLLGGSSVWAINKFMSKPKDEQQTPSGGNKTPNGGGQTPNGGGQTPNGGNQTPSEKDYTTTIQESGFVTPEILINTDPNLDYQFWYLNNWIWLNQNDIMSALAQPYWNWGIDVNGKPTGVNWFYFNQLNDKDGFKAFVDFDQSYYTDAAKKNLVVRVTPFTTPNSTNGLTQKQIDDSLIKQLQANNGLSLKTGTDFLSRLRKNKGFDIRSYLQDNH